MKNTKSGTTASVDSAETTNNVAKEYPKLSTFLFVVAVVIGITFPAVIGLIVASVLTMLFAPTFLGISLVGAAFIISLKMGVAVAVVFSLAIACVLLYLRRSKEAKCSAQ